MSVPRRYDQWSANCPVVVSIPAPGLYTGDLMCGIVNNMALTKKSKENSSRTEGLACSRKLPRYALDTYHNLNVMYVKFVINVCSKKNACLETWRT